MELKPAKWWRDDPPCPKCGVEWVRGLAHPCSRWVTRYCGPSHQTPPLEESIKATCTECGYEVACEVCSQGEG